VLARLLTGLTLAAFASAAALGALEVRSGLDHPARAVAGTVMFAVIYTAIGATVGALTRNPVNGTVIVLFIWILDVFFGPAMGSADRIPTRALPTHFVTLWMLDLPSSHTSQLDNLGWALAWTLAAVVAARAIVVTRTRTARSHSHPAHGHARTRDLPSGMHPTQVGAAFAATWRDARRNPTQWALFVIVPVVFILGAYAVTPNKPITVVIDDHGQRIARAFAMPLVHGATMAPIAIASLSALVGLFGVLDSRNGDRRAALAGLKTNALLSARLGVLAVSAIAATAVALGATALVFHATQWPTYAAANLLLALTYGLIGALLAPIFGRAGGVFVAFLLPFLDLGIVQSPMLHPTPTAFSKLLPGYGGSRVLLDGALTRGFDETLPLLIGFAWLIGLTAAVTVTYRHAVRTATAT
jgi:hypothetical protein